MASGSLALTGQACAAHWPTSREPVDIREVHRILSVVADAGCLTWIGGGWGVDALVGRQIDRFEPQ